MADDHKDLIFEVLRAVADEHSIELSLSTDLAMDLKLDSVKTMEVILELEDRLDILIPQNILPNLRTLGDLVRELNELT